MNRSAKELVVLAREVLAARHDQRFLKRMIELEPKSGVMAVGRGKKPVKYDHAFLKRMIELEPKSGVMAAGRSGKAKKRQAFEFPSQETYDKYLKAHPGADKSLHWVRPSHLSRPPQTPDEAAERKFGKTESHQSLSGDEYRELNQAIDRDLGGDNTQAGHVAGYGIEEFAKKKHPGGAVEVTRTPDGKIAGLSYTWFHRNGDLEVDALSSSGKVPGMGSFLIARVIRHRLKKGRNLRLTALPEADGFYEHLGMEETGINEYGGCNWQFSYDQAKKFSDFIYGQVYGQLQVVPKSKEKPRVKPLQVVARELVRVARELIAGIYEYDKIAEAVQRVHDELKGDVPFIRATPSTLGGRGRSAIMLVISFDPKETWANGILENSRYARISVDESGTIEKFSGSALKMRKTRVDSLDAAIRKIRDYIKKAKMAA